MFTYKFLQRIRKYAGISTLGAASIASSFFLGIQSVGEVQPFTLIEAGTVLAGDMNEDGFVNVEDAIIILEVSEGYQDATPEQLLADPNDDGVLTVSDALHILDLVRKH